MESDFEEVVFPEFVNLIDNNEEGNSELNVSALDKTFQPEDFSSEFRYVRVFFFDSNFLEV